MSSLTSRRTREREGERERETSVGSKRQGWRAKLPWSRWSGDNDDRKELPTWSIWRGGGEERCPTVPNLDGWPCLRGRRAWRRRQRGRQPASPPAANTSWIQRASKSASQSANLPACLPACLLLGLAVWVVFFFPVSLIFCLPARPPAHLLV